MSSKRELYSLHIDYTKVYNTAGHKICDSQIFSYIIDIERDGMPWTWTEWCKNNCESIWGWWFDSKSCYVGFESESEAILFALTFKGDTTT